MSRLQRVCINCGSSPGLLPAYMENASLLGRHLAEQKIEVVFGGADVGLMGAVADAALACGGRVIGVIPESIAAKVGHRGLTELHVVASMHERKQMMFDLSDAFVGLPGGIGTLEEVLEVLTWAQLGFHGKPCGLLNVAGYFDHLLRFLDRSTEHRFVRPEHRSMLLVANEPTALLNQFREYAPSIVEKWIDRKP